MDIIEQEQTMEYFSNLYLKHYGENESLYFRTAWTPFHTAIVKGYKGKLEKMLQDAAHHPKLQYLMLNSQIMYDKNWTNEIKIIASALKPDKSCKFVESVNCNLLKIEQTCDKLQTNNYKLPLAIACLSGDIEVVNLLLRYGIRICASDSFGSTVLHSLAMISKTRPQFAIRVYDILLSHIHLIGDKYDFVTQVNNAGFTALDIAAKEHCLEFIQALFHTKGVYKFVTNNNGPYRDVLYDITRYDVERFSKVNSGDDLPFLCRIALVHEYELKYFHKCKMLTKEPFKTWIKCKSEMYRWDLYGWLSLSALFLLMLMAQIVWYYAGSSHDIAQIFCIIILINALFSLISQTICLCTERKIYKYVWQTWSEKGLPIAFKSHYIYLEVLFAVLVIIIQSLHLSGFTCDDYNNDMFTILYVYAVLDGFIAFLKFTQLNYRVAHFIIQIDRMLFDIMLFLAVWFLIYFTYAIVFYILHFEHHCEIHSNNVSANYNDTMFANFWRTTYETFIMGLYIIPPKPLYFEQSEWHIVSMIVYTLFLVAVSMVMVNVIIARMIEKVKQLHRYKSTVSRLQFIVSAMFMEGIASSFMIWLNVLKFRHDRVSRKYFIKSEDGSKVFIRVVETLPHLRANVNSNKICGDCMCKKKIS